MSEKQPEKAEEKTPNGATRRELFQIGNALALPVLLGGVQAKAAGPLKPGPGIYQSIGVEPVINCRGTFTIIGASVELPEVRAAMDAAAQQFVQLDELAEAVGRRLAELTGAEWGMVSSGCAAGLKHVAAACIAGGNPEKLLRIPDLTGIDKTEVVAPRSARSAYDHALSRINTNTTQKTRCFLTASPRLGGYHNLYRRLNFLELSKIIQYHPMRNEPERNGGFALHQHCSGHVCGKHGVEVGAVFRQPPSIISVASSVLNPLRHQPQTTAEGTLHLGHTTIRRLLPKALEYSIPISGVGVRRLSTTGCIGSASAHVLCLVSPSFLAPAHCRYSLIC